MATITTATKRCDVTVTTIAPVEADLASALAPVLATNIDSPLAAGPLVPSARGRVVLSALGTFFWRLTQV